MVHFVLAGKPNCKHFVHCIYIADYLDKHLPHFQYRTLQFELKEWPTWLLKTNMENGWFHTTSPLIWKEVNRRGGTPYLIGGISDFWEYIYDYYGLQSMLPTHTLNKLLRNNLTLFEETIALEKNRTNMTRKILIYGATNPMIPFLLPALNDIPGLGLTFGIQIILFQPDIASDQEEYLRGLVNDFKIINDNIELAFVLDKSLFNVELVIYTESCNRDEETDFDQILLQQAVCMKQLASTITRTGKRGIKIIIANDGPVCFNANIFLSASPFLRHGNIVAVTADRGFSRLRAAGTALNLSLTELGAPPVWGSVGLTSSSEFVDISGTVQRARVYRPYARALRVGTTSTLALGTVQTELRMLSYLTERLDVEEIVRSREETIKRRLGRKSCLSKVRAVLDVIRLWYAGKEEGDIISLGVASDGSFDIPNGLYFSQPVMLQDKIWKPIRNFPITAKTKEKIATLVPEALKRVEDYVLK